MPIERKQNSSFKISFQSHNLRENYLYIVFINLIAHMSLSELNNAL
jgi:hypothetical protein